MHIKFLKHCAFLMPEEKNTLYEKYLSLLGLRKCEASYGFLCKIVKAHLKKIPFENISKLLFKKRGLTVIPSLSEHLNGIEKYKFGGTCYAINYHLNQLLKQLGFDVRLCGADMKDPDVHIISVVTIGENEFIVDCGYAAPFFDPLPRDLKGFHYINFGNENYIIKPKDKTGRTIVEQYYNSRLQHWYTAKPQARKIEDFKKVIEDSYADDATFMNAIRITRFTESGSLILKNLCLTEIVNNKISALKINRKDLPVVIEQKFGMPPALVVEATSHLKELKDIYD